MGIGSEETSTDIVITDKPDLSAAKETGIDEIQREITTTILERLKDPRAVNLVYPGVHPIIQEDYGSAPNYEQGSQRRFIVLDGPSFLGTDQICIAATDNKSRGNSRTQGAGLMQKGRGQHSEKEIALTRFVQTPSERFKHGGNEGTYYLIVLSDNLKDDIGTMSIKARARPNRDYPPFAGKEGAPPFAQLWRNGNFQLSEAFHYDVSGKKLDFQESDYRDILKALKTAKVNSQMTSKVASSEEKYHYAKKNTP